MPQAAAHHGLPELLDEKRLLSDCNVEVLCRSEVEVAQVAYVAAAARPISEEP